MSTPNTQDRPKFFKNCPVCNAETPPGITHCPQCGVDLEIARANMIKDVALAAGTYGYTVAQQSNQPKLLNDLWYVVIGFIANIAISILIFAVMYVIHGLGVLFYLAYGFFLTYVSTIGRYGKINFYGFMNLGLWSAIPIINWTVVYYFGKGLHISLTKQKLVDPPIATSIGTIISAGLLFIGFIGVLATSLVSISSGSISTPAATYIPSPLPTDRFIKGANTAASESCLLWSQITPQMAGQKVCVYGTIYQITTSRETYTRIEFTDKPNTFFLYSIHQYFYHTDTGKNIARGECLSYTGEIATISGIPYIDLGDNVPNYCEPWMENK